MSTNQIPWGQFLYYATKDKPMDRVNLFNVWHPKDNALIWLAKLAFYPWAIVWKIGEMFYVDNLINHTVHCEQNFILFNFILIWLVTPVILQLYKALWWLFTKGWKWALASDEMKIYDGMGW